MGLLTLTSASLNKQLTYKNGGQKYRASNLSVSLPGVSEDAFKKLFGEDLVRNVHFLFISCRLVQEVMDPRCPSSH